MGVVFGQITFENIASGYDYFKSYCLANEIELLSDSPDDRLIATADIPSLKLIDCNGIEIKGQGTNIEGVDSDIFEIIILGVPYPFYEEEFPQHVKTYYNRNNIEL